MKIVADAGILGLEQYFSRLGELSLIPGRDMHRAQLQDADVLLVRSITSVNATLLKDTGIRFVGTATSGTDHIDLTYLREHQIEFAHAAGSNANAVVDYCFSALAHVELSGHHTPVADCTIGLIGAGEVGSRFAARLEALGMRYQVYDPPLEMRLRNGGIPTTAFFPALSRFVTLDTVLRSDIVSLHVPLSESGEHKTRQLLDHERLQRLAPGCVIINTCRGAVVDEAALLEMLRSTDGTRCIVDVWENEPTIDPELVAAVEIATPHIAGYSENAKRNATAMLYRQLCHFIGSAQQLPESVSEAVAVSPREPIDEKSHWRLLLDLLPLCEIDANCKASAKQGAIAVQFDEMRVLLKSRGEFRDYQLDMTGLSKSQQSFLAAMGIQQYQARR